MGKVEVLDETAPGERRDEKRDVEDTTESRTEPESRFDMPSRFQRSERVRTRATLEVGQGEEVNVEKEGIFRLQLILTVHDTIPKPFAGARQTNIAEGAVHLLLFQASSPPHSRRRVRENPCSA